MRFQFHGPGPQSSQNRATIVDMVKFLAQRGAKTLQFKTKNLGAVTVIASSLDPGGDTQGLQGLGNLGKAP
jgi:hypothetical protein